MKKIKGAIIGRDIAYTKSPALYRQYFSDQQIDGTYEILDFKTEKELRLFLESAEAKTYQFFNITQPYKAVFMDYLDAFDIVVNETQSINMVLNKKGKFKGYNTDSEGFMTYYFDSLVECSIENILLVGTGAMARTAKVYIQQATPADLYIMSPRQNKIPDFFNKLEEFHPLKTEAPALCHRFDLMVFAASHKAESMVADMPIQVDKIINVNYQSEVLKNFAKLNKIKYIDGKFMLLEQFKENLKLLSIYDEDYEFIDLGKKVLV